MAKHEYIMCSVCVCACTDMSSASNEICITCTSILYGLWIPSAMPRRRRTPCRMRAAVCLNCLLCDSFFSLSLSPSLCLSLTHTVSLCLVISLFDIAWAILISKSSNSCRLSLSPFSLLFSPNWQPKGTRDYLTSSNSLDWINRYEQLSNSNCTCLLCWHSWVRAGEGGEVSWCRLAVWPNCLKMLSAFLGGGA